MILTRTPDIGQKIDKAVFPGFQGGPIMQMVAAKAVAFGEALQPEFRVYAQQVIRNASFLAAFLMRNGVKLVTNGTDNHLLLIDCIRSWNLSGGAVERVLDQVNITANKNMIPDDLRKPMDPSGLRIGTPAITTRGMREPEMEILGTFMLRAIEHRDDPATLRGIREEATAFCRKFPVPGAQA
jgi:glycine hydroxymethyltransferase